MVEEVGKDRSEDGRCCGYIKTGQEDGREDGKGQDKKMVGEKGNDRTRRWSKMWLKTGPEMVEEVGKNRTEDG